MRSGDAKLKVLVQLNIMIIVMKFPDGDLKVAGLGCLWTTNESIFEHQVNE